MEELQTQIKLASLKLKKATGMVNKFGNLSAKGKCSDQDWEKAIDDWGETVDECFEILIEIKSITQ